MDKDVCDLADESHPNYEPVCQQIALMASLPSTPHLELEDAYVLLRDVLVQEEISENARAVLTGMAACFLRQISKTQIIVEAEA